MSADHIPARTKTAFRCPACGVVAQQDWGVIGALAYDDNGVDYITSLGAPPPRSVWDQIPHAVPVASSRIVDGDWVRARCTNCQGVMLWNEDTIVYPRTSTAPAPHVDMPESVRVLYQEASDVLPVSRRAGAAMIRATLEALLRELDQDAPRNAALDERILRVESRVTSSLASVLTLIRHAGNKSLHIQGAPDDVVLMVLDPQDYEIVDVMFGAINDVVDELVAKPNHAARLLDLVPEEVRQAIDRKRLAKGGTDAQ